MDITVFLGAPGSGKGTQAKRLSDHHHFIHLSTGDILRVAIKDGTEVGKKAKAFLDKGELVPDPIMIALIEDVLGKLAPNSKVLLDGFPRTLHQAEALDKNPKTKSEKAVYFEMPESFLMKRLSGRRVCSQCGESFHVDFLSPRMDGICDKCGGKLYQRTDDQADVVAKRLQVYKDQTTPLLNYFKQSGKLQTVDANGSVDNVQNQLLKLLS